MTGTTAVVRRPTARRLTSGHGWLAVLLAARARAHVGQRRVRAAILSQPSATALVWLMTLGLAAYPGWRFTEASFGVTG